LGTDRSKTSHLVSWKNEARFELTGTAPLALEGWGLETNDTVYFTYPLDFMNGELKHFIIIV
ncbi:MAG TPA: hypothetical protein VNI52_02550, partial [Sphingobacteriaceae bacterium]|nr:hypothetical protein [Sphingobacteriaceae bacterium]